jgi:hypothetical protein
MQTYVVQIHRRPGDGGHGCQFVGLIEHAESAQTIAFRGAAHLLGLLERGWPAPDPAATAREDSDLTTHFSVDAPTRPR